MRDVFDPRYCSLENVRERILKEMLCRQLTRLTARARLTSFSAAGSSIAVTTISTNACSGPFGVFPKTNCPHFVPGQIPFSQGFPDRFESGIQVPIHRIPCLSFKFVHCVLMSANFGFLASEEIAALKRAPEVWEVYPPEVLPIRGC